MPTSSDICTQTHEKRSSWFNFMEMEIRKASLKVFMLPWLAYGHISPFLELAKKLTKRNLFIYLCSTPVNLQSIKKKLDSNVYSNSIQLVELHLPSSPDQLPPHLHTTNGLPPQFFVPLLNAFQSSLPNLSNILRELNPDVLIHDSIHPSLGQLPPSLNILPIEFLPSGATSFSFFENKMHNPGVEYPIAGIYLHEFEMNKLVSIARNSGKDFKSMQDSNKSRREKTSSCNIMLIKSFRELEGEAIDFASIMTKKKIIPVGSLTEFHIHEKDDHEKEKKGMIHEWLDKKDKSSTVFVCFGSECCLSKEDMEEMAYGLESSNVNFIWVVSFQKKEGEEIRRMELEEELPKGYLERVGDRGMVLEGWAPQMEILSHESIGGFVSHCGWSSTMESLIHGVPIIALPMTIDQPLNARLMVKVGVAVEVKRDINERIQRQELTKVIRQVVVDESGQSVRKKAKELADNLRVDGEVEIDGFVQEILRTCEENKVGREI